MRICKKRSPLLSDLYLNNSTLQSTSDFCDLGLVTNCNLSWNNHIDKISSKANRILGLIKRTCRGLKDVPTLRTLYLALVRSQLEFCSVVWSPYQASNIIKLERIQQRAIKLILKLRPLMNISNEEKKLNLLSLEQRRLLFDILFLYTVLNGHIDIDLSNNVQFFKESDHYMQRRKDDCALKKNCARTNIFKYSYFNRIVNMWNSLPHSVRRAHSVEIFKKLRVSGISWSKVWNVTIILFYCFGNPIYYRIS